MIYYKLTDKDGKTRGGMDWPVGRTNRATGKGKKLCTDGYLHVYDTPEQAVFMRPAHVKNYTRLWEVRSRSKGITDGTKRGIKSCTVVGEIPLPEMTIEQRVEIAIRVSLLVYRKKSYVRWAIDWLSGKDRSAEPAYAANAATAANAAANAAAWAAATAANAAAYAATAANAAANAAAWAATAANAAANAAARAAATAANAAAWAAARAAEDIPIDLVGIIQRVLEEKP